MLDAGSSYTIPKSRTAKQWWQLTIKWNVNSSKYEDSVQPTLWISHAGCTETESKPDQDMESRAKQIKLWVGKGSVTQANIGVDMCRHVQTCVDCIHRYKPVYIGIPIADKHLKFVSHKQLPIELAAAAASAIFSALRCWPQALPWWRYSGPPSDMK